MKVYVVFCLDIPYTDKWIHSIYLSKISAENRAKEIKQKHDSYIIHIEEHKFYE